MVMIGIWNYVCPSCKRHQKSQAKFRHFSDLIPLDVNRIFFRLLDAKIQRIRSRQS